MNLTKTYSERTRDVKQLKIQPYCEGVTFSSPFYGRGYQYTFSISPRDYLATAKRAVSQLKEISGMDYCIMAKHPDSTTWRGL